MTPFSTLLGELQLGRGLRRCYTPLYDAIILQIGTFVKIERAVFSVLFQEAAHFQHLRSVDGSLAGHASDLLAGGSLKN
jgi:hypothetical protein